jgi:hypothetical protein
LHGLDVFCFAHRSVPSKRSATSFA